MYANSAVKRPTIAILVSLVWAFSPACAWAIVYTHQLLLGGVLHYSGTGPYSLADDGSYLIAADVATGSGHVVIMNGTQLPESIDGIRLSGGAINARGDWLVNGIWKSDPNWGTVNRMIKNGEVLDHGWSSDFWWGSKWGYLSKSGKAVWTNGTFSYQYVVVDGVNYSDQWSDGYLDKSLDVLSDGTPVWYGRERGHSEFDLWIGGDPVSRRYDLGEWDWRNAMDTQYRWVDVNDAGEVAWVAAKTPGSVGYHVFKGDYDLTTAVFGPGGWAWTGVFLNERGNVLWKAGRYLYLDEQRLWFIEAILASGGIAINYGLNDASDVLWLRRQEGVRPDTVYINDHNLVEDVFGSAYLSSVPLALNNAGQVLWSVNTLDGKWSIYLSTPVPEPGGVVLVAPALLLMAIRRRRRPSIKGDLAA